MKKLMIVLLVQLAAACGGGGAPAPPVGAILTSPPNNSSFASNTVEFTRGSSTPAASNYYLWVGSAPRARDTETPLPNNIDFANADLTLVSAMQFATLPTNGSAVYVTLWSKIDGKLYAHDYTFTAFNSGSAAK